MISRDFLQKINAVHARVAGVWDVEKPAAGFYFWPKTPIDDQDFARRLYEDMNVTVLPGSYLARHAHGLNPGQRRIRLALVPPLKDCVEAADRICELLTTLT